MGEWKKDGKLGDCLELRAERNTKRENELVLTVSNIYGVIPQADMFNHGRILASENTSGYRVVRKDDFAYNPARINVGSIGRLDDYDMGIISPMYVCFNTNNGLNGDYLEQFLKTKYFNDAVKRRLSGSVRECLNFSGLCDIDISYPLDTKEQRRIAAVLTAADEAITASQALVEKYASVKQGLVSDLLGHGEKVSLKKLGGRFIRGHGITRADIRDNGVPCIRYGELYTTYDIWLDEPISHVSEELAKQCFHIKHGDLLFTLSGETAEEIGKTVVYLGEEDAVVGGDLAVFTGHKQNPLYLSYILNAPDALKQKELRATGSMVVHINSKKIEEVSVPLPSLPEQERIAEILTAADDRLTAEREQLRKLEDIKRGLMDDLLTNRVSTDKLQGGI
jgi:type I restriction enzyme S subunit